MRTLSEYEASGEIPCFCKDRTALYVSYTSKKSWSFIRAWHHISTRVSAATLLNHGYDTFIVDYGTSFGKAALHELISIRRRRDYTLIAVKIAGEKNYYSNRLNEIKDLTACDLSLGLIGKSDFLSALVMQSSAIVNASQIQYHNGSTPQRLASYLKQIK